MGGYIDIHTHVLPGLDDGARDLDDAMGMLRMAAADGTKTIICTPHYLQVEPRSRSKHYRECTPGRIHSLVAELNAKCDGEGLGLTLHPGCELHWSVGIGRLLEQGRVATLAGGGHVLVEFAPWAAWETMIDGLLEISGLGFEPILAHAERYDCLAVESEGKKRLRLLRHFGIRLQLNAGAVMRKEKITKHILAHALADFVASDAHDDGQRGPRLSACHAFIARRHGKRYAELLFRENAEAMLAGADGAMPSYGY